LIAKRLSEKEALDLLGRCISPALNCAKAWHRQKMNEVKLELRKAVAKELGILANCLHRMPRAAAKRMDQQLWKFLARAKGDAGTIHPEMFAIIAKVCKGIPGNAAARRATDALLRIERDLRLDPFLDAEFCETLQAYAATREAPASEILRAMRDRVSLLITLVDEIKPAELLQRCARELAVVWHDVGLRTGRGAAASNNRSEGAFHVFCDLLLTAFIEPDARRHSGPVSSVKSLYDAAYQSVPVDERSVVNTSPPRRHIEFLVSEHHLRS
jgi:hypothetical protein